MISADVREMARMIARGEVSPEELRHMLNTAINFAVLEGQYDVACRINEYRDDVIAAMIEMEKRV